MKISCPACQAKYSIADEKVTDRLAKIRCRKCGATIVIDGKTNPANVYTAAGDAPDAGTAAAVEQDSGMQYSVDFGEGDQRSLTIAELITAYNSG
ncbi:MAG TPA: zinc-ribbon domain-containing protein, partial [Polyangiales bacterium]